MSNENEQYETPLSQIEKLMSSYGRTREDEDKAFAIYAHHYKLCTGACEDCCGDWRVFCCRPKTAEDIMKEFEEGIQILMEATQHIQSALERGQTVEGDLKELLDITKATAKLAYDKLAEVKQKRKQSQ